MPACELPENLQNIMSTLLETNQLRSWQIYSEKHGITLKIRLSECSNGEPTNVKSVSYTKKSPSRMKRDNTRISERRVTMSQMKDNEVELPRGNNAFNSDGHDILTGMDSPILPEPCGQSPVTSPLPVSTPISVTNMSLLNDSHVSQSGCDQQSVDHDTHNMPLGLSAESLGKNIASTPDEDTSASEDGSHPHDATFSKDWQSCYNTLCCYGSSGGTKTTEDRYVCKSCGGAQVIVCVPCYNTTDFRHKKHMTLMNYDEIRNAQVKKPPYI